MPGQRKLGRNKKKCEQYKAENTRKNNKEKKKLRYELKMEKSAERKLKRVEKKKLAKAEAPVSTETQDA
jgi:hypothetical protein